MILNYWLEVSFVIFLLSTEDHEYIFTSRLCPFQFIQSFNHIYKASVTGVGKYLNDKSRPYED